MEQHPVPRNISSFQFHLIGDMTIRQFAYMAGGVILAFVIYKIFPVPAIIKFPVMGMVGFIGFAFAFLPIQERPLDRWIVAFVRSINAPTQYLWQKNNPPPEILTRSLSRIITPVQPTQAENHRVAHEKLLTYLATLPTQPHQVINRREEAYLSKTLSLFNSANAPLPDSEKPIVTPVVIRHPQQPPVINQVHQAHPMSTVKPQPVPVPPPPPVNKPLQVAPPTVQTIIPQAPPPPVEKTQPKIEPIDVSSMQKTLSALAAEKELLREELMRLKSEMGKSSEQNIVKPVSKTVPPPPTIQSVAPKQVADEIGMPSLPTVGNIVLGVVKDRDRRFLPNIVLTIKERGGTPLRAMKTNKIGQFATATPLSNGIYLLEAEDPLKRYVFDIAEITLTGKIFLPVEIVAKEAKDLLREQLTRELFGNNVPAPAAV
jgi:hypothetical protein